MRFHPTPLAGLQVVELEPRGDERGLFARLYCQQEMREQGLSDQIAQANTSYSRHRGTLRGLHFQLPPRQETKLVRCIHGTIFDVALDLRRSSPTFGQSWGLELSAKNRQALYIPKGFAHGFFTLEDDCEVLYFVDEFYSPEFERGIRWNDPFVKVEWPAVPSVVSGRDQQHPDFDISLAME